MGTTKRGKSLIYGMETLPKELLISSVLYIPELQKTVEIEDTTGMYKTWPLKPLV